MTVDIKATASNTLEQMLSAGFDAAQVSVSVSERDELNIAHNEPSLLRSTEGRQLALNGIVDGRKASATITDLTDGAISQGIKELFERAQLAPQDEANAVSSGQTGHFEQGPLSSDREMLVAKVEELLSFRENNTPRMNIEEGAADHRVGREQLMTSEGTELSAVIGCYSLSVMGTASEGDKSSSFNYTGGTSNDLSVASADALFGIGDMLRDTENQIDTRAVDGNFVGDIVLAPTAVGDLLGWLLGQISDFALISDASVFKDKVGTSIAASMLTVKSRFDAPGRAAYTGDGFLAPALTLVDEGTLTTLLPSFYGSKKTGITHRPSSSGWMIEPGATARSEMIAGIGKGALVNRLSMGSPAANGDFSGVIKNSFLIEDGGLSDALSETMISGNMADMLKDIVSISSEHLDLGGEDFPWIRIAGLHFS